MSSVICKNDVLLLNNSVINRVKENTHIHTMIDSTVNEGYHSRDCCAFIVRKYSGQCIISLKDLDSSITTNRDDILDYWNNVMKKYGVSYMGILDPAVFSSDISSKSPNHTYVFDLNKNGHYNLVPTTLIRFLQTNKIYIPYIVREMEKEGIETNIAIGYANILYSILNNDWDATFSFFTSSAGSFKPFDESNKSKITSAREFFIETSTFPFINTFQMFIKKFGNDILENGYLWGLKQYEIFLNSKNFSFDYFDLELKNPFITYKNSHFISKNFKTIIPKKGLSKDQVLNMTCNSKKAPSVKLISYEE